MDLQDLVTKSWHSVAGETVADYFSSDTRSGLKRGEAERRLKKFGENTLPSYQGKSLFSRILNQINNPLILVLIGAGIITLLLKDYLDSSVIFAVVIINAIIGLIQEGKAESALAAVSSMLANQATVIRDGQKISIDAKDLVPGDIVLLESGCKVPADLRIISSRNLRIDESALTGESIASDKSAEPVPEDSVTADQSSMAFSGTLVVFGIAKGLVTATGNSTQLGKIGTLVSDTSPLVTPLTKRLELFAKQITVFILIFGLLAYLYGVYLKNLSQIESFLVVIGMAVAAIPEGLPAIVTIVLAIGTRAMATNNAIVRRLPAVETLGSVTVICSDKTGTLTKNEMTAVKIITRDSLVKVTGAGYQPSGDFLINESKINPLDYEDIKDILQAAALCNDARIIENANHEWEIVGDPTEGALLTLAEKALKNSDNNLTNWKRLDQIPFESENRFMATLNQDLNGKKFIFLKGAPEKILELCSENETPFWLEQIELAGKNGQRVLGFAKAEFVEDSLELTEQNLTKNLQIIGLVGLIDPPRPEAIFAVSECKTAGIKVKMITGDHAATATSIANQLGLEATTALTGQEIEAMSETELIAAIQAHDVIARANPEHKMRIVLALQKLGNYVAMTGDGVNDAPALKAADIGIAMGKRGTDAARNASDLILTDDNFATIERAVERGRVVFDNIKKSFLFVLPTNGGETGLILSALIIGLTMPVTVPQILWVNLVTTVTLNFAIAFEKPEKNIMKRPPRSPKEPLLTRPLLIRIIFVSVLMTIITLFAFQWELSRGSSVEIARTTAVNVLVFSEILYLINIRHFTKSSLYFKAFTENRVAVFVIFLLIFLQLALTYLPISNQIFDTRPLDLWSWLVILGLSVAKFFVMEIEKVFWRFKKVDLM